MLKTEPIPKPEPSPALSSSPSLDSLLTLPSSLPLQAFVEKVRLGESLFSTGLLMIKGRLQSYVSQEQTEESEQVVRIKFGRFG